MKAAGTFVSDTCSVDQAIAWIDAATSRLDSEDIVLAGAQVLGVTGRMLAEDIRADRAIPGEDCAMLDGFAVEARASLGASVYNQVELPLRAVDAGDPLPTGSDAVVPLDLAQPDDRGHVELVEAIASGDNVQRQGAVAVCGAILALAETQLAARHIGLLALAGIGRVRVIRRPVVQIVLAGWPRPDAVKNSNGPMLHAAIERDGGVVQEFTSVEQSRRAIADALTETRADLVLVIGGTGPGRNDHAVAALAKSGELSIHGVALRPGETTAFGRTGSGVPVILLPGAPAACLWSYELFAGRAIRRLGGYAAALPYQPREMIAARKIVSAIGMTEICPVRCLAGDLVEPTPSFAEAGLMAAINAGGFVIMPEGSEGYPQGARVTVYLY